jgi:hypothetical protein
MVPRITIAHAHTPTALVHVEAGRIDGLAEYLAGFVRQLDAAGSTFAAIPASRPEPSSRSGPHYRSTSSK